MATAKRVKLDKREVKVWVPAVAAHYATQYQDQPDNVVLELTLEDARVLYLVTGRIGGSPQGRRGAMDRIRVALQDAKVPNSIEDEFGNSAQGSLHI